jgi:CheY-like chemotaxis protein
MGSSAREPTTAADDAAPEVQVLVVDDSAIERRLAGRLIEKSGELSVLSAANGHEALEVIEQRRPAVVLTDLQMPGLDGLALVKEVRRCHPDIPVVLMTAFGSEEIAIEALQAGAASYVPKRALASDLVSTLRRVLEVAAVNRTRQRLLSSLQRHESFFRLENDPDLLGPLVELFLGNLAGMDIGDATTRLRIGVALQEALTNALYHGNLEVSSDLRQEDERRFYDLAEQRRVVDPYRSRRIDVRSTLDRSGLLFVIRDEGPGFDVQGSNRPIDPEDLMRIGGRGLLLIRAFMDEVRHNASGNEITMVKREKDPVVGVG